VPLYQVAARARLHPATLSAVLNERRPLDAKVAQRILAALEERR
jgi:DNA-binding LacI/PurR family transcriptional regulator